MSVGDNSTPDFHAILTANASRVFSERDERKRLAALSELWLSEALLYEEGHVESGIAEISNAVGALLETLPPGTHFVADGIAVGHHGLGRLRWQAFDAAGDPMPVTGTDVAFIKDGRIASLYVLLDPRD